MTNIKNGVNYGDYNFANGNSQIGGNDTKANKVNFSDDLTKKESQKTNAQFEKGNRASSENELVEVCLEDDTETSGTKGQEENKSKNVSQKQASSTSQSDSTSTKKSEETSSKVSASTSAEVGGKDDVNPSVKTQSGTSLPESLSFGPNISISDIKSGSKQGEFYNEMKMDGKTYKRTEVTKNSSGTEFYTLKPEPNDGSRIVVEKQADGTQYFCVYGTNRSPKSKLQLDQGGNARSIFRYENGLAYEREYFETGLVRRYERDENGNLVSSKDYQKKDDGTIDLKRPLSSQEYIDVGDIGKQWSNRVIYEYDEDGNQKIKETHKYDYDLEKDENGDYTGKLTISRQVFEGDSTDINDLIAQYIEEFMEGILQSTEEIDKDKKSTKVVYNSDGSTTTTITEGDKVTVIEKDDKGEIISETITENGETRTIDHTKDKEEDKENEEDEDSSKSEVETSDVEKSDKSDNKDQISPEDAISALKSNGYQNDAEKIAKAIFGDKTEGSAPNQQVTPEDAMKKITELGYSEEEAKDIVETIFGEKK